MSNRGTDTGGNRFKMAVAKAFLARTQLRRWMDLEVKVDGTEHTFHVHHDGLPSDLIAHSCSPERDVIPLNAKRREVSVSLANLTPPFGRKDMKRPMLATQVGRYAGNWLDGKVASTLVSQLASWHDPIDVDGDGISSGTLIKARSLYLQDGYPQMDVLCAILPAGWYVGMLDKQMPIRDGIYYERLAGGIEVVFRPNEEMRRDEEGYEVGFIIAQDSVGWAEGGWLSEFSCEYSIARSESELSEQPEGMQHEVFEKMYRGGCGLLTRSAGIIELRFHTGGQKSKEIAAESKAGTRPRTKTRVAAMGTGVATRRQMRGN